MPENLQDIMERVYSLNAITYSFMMKSVTFASENSPEIMLKGFPGMELCRFGKIRHECFPEG